MSARLITIPMSHFCEKARWALDHSGVEYHEDGRLQGLHYLSTARAGGGRTVPVLVVDDGTVLCDSTDIVRWADVRAPSGVTLLANEPDQVAAMKELERWGVQTRLWAYHRLLLNKEIAIRLLHQGVPRWQAMTIRPLFGVLSAFLVDKLGATDERVARAVLRIEQRLDRVADTLADGRPYLTGDTFTALDLTFCALGAPMVLPSGYGKDFRLPPLADLLKPASAEVVKYREHPAGQFILRVYAQRRKRV